MKSTRVLSFIMLAALVVCLIPAAHAGLGDLLKDAKQAVGLGGGLSDSKITKGLKEALQIGTKNAVDMVSRTNGYYKNPEVKIPLPKAVRKVEKVLRAVGYGKEVDAFELSMNRAAEKAAPKAKSLFWRITGCSSEKRGEETCEEASEET